MKPSFPTVISLALALASSAQAASVAITNHSFETPAIGSDNTFSLAATKPSGTFNGWSYVIQTGGGFQDFGIENPGSGQYTNAAGSSTPLGADGTNIAWLNQSINGGTVHIFQDVGSLQANTTYTLTVALGQRLDRTNGSTAISLYNGTSGTTDPTLLATLDSTTGVSAVAGSFQDFVVTFTTGSSVSDNLFVGASYTGDGTIQASLDNFRLDATVVPEPGAVVISLASIGGLLLVRRRRY